LVFGGVSAQLRGFSNPRLRQSLAKKPKILASHRYIISVNALVLAVEWRHEHHFLHDSTIQELRKPRFGFGGKIPFGITPGEFYFTRVQSVMRQDQLAPLRIREAILHQRQI
jgi:hypothetical protein